MPFVRTSRDKRGYEHIYLIDTPINRGRASASRVLYWFRTPPGVKVGREPFDDATRRALEAQYPNLIFDWKKLANTPMPPPDAEHWRERRRLERSAKQARAAEEREEAAAAAAAVPRAAEATVAAVAGTDIVPDVDSAAVADVPAAPDVVDAPAPGAVSATAAPVGAMAPDSGRPPEQRRRRRRGGRRRRRPQGAPDAQGPAPEIVVAADPGSSTLDPHDSSTLNPHEEE